VPELGAILSPHCLTLICINNSFRSEVNVPNLTFATKAYIQGLVAQLSPEILIVGSVTIIKSRKPIPSVTYLVLF